MRADTPTEKHADTYIYIYIYIPTFIYLRAHIDTSLSRSRNFPLLMEPVKKVPAFYGTHRFIMMF